MTETSPTPTGDPIEQPNGRARALALGIGAIVVIAVVALLVFLALRSDDTETVTDDTTTITTDDTTTTTVIDATTSAPETTVADTTTPAPETTAPETTAPDTTTTIAETTTTTATTDPTTTVAGTDPTPDELAFTVWPPADSDLRYTDPLEAAEGFVVDFLGMTDPLIGEFRLGDARSGEVEVRGIEGATPTLVSLSTFGTGGTWWVLGAYTTDIVVDQPTFDSVVTSPLRLAGRSVTFEATVEVAIREHGVDDPLYEGFVTGGAAPGDLAPFDETIEWDAPDTGRGVIVFFERSSDDGRVLQATIVRVEFGQD